MLGLLTLLIACEAPNAQDPTGADTGADTSAPATAALPDPSWDSAGVAAQINAGLALGLPDPSTLLAEFKTMFAGVEAGCPMATGYSLEELVGWCVTTSGWLYAGVSGLEPGEGEDFWLMGDCYIIDPEGQTFTCAGELERETTGDGWALKLTGQWGFDGSDTPWVAVTPGVALWETLDGDGLHLDGGYGPGEIDLFFEDVVMADGCATGVVWLRDPAGSWYTLTLADTCDGCGEVQYGDEALGQACIDLAPAMTELSSRME